VNFRNRESVEGGRISGGRDFTLRNIDQELQRTFMLVQTAAVKAWLSFDPREHTVHAMSNAA
jgi:hypothetical protein